jgi:hypothetical protein
MARRELAVAVGYATRQRTTLTRAHDTLTCASGALVLIFY